MKKILFLISITFLILQSCSSGDDNTSKESEKVVEDNIKPPYTVRYEVKFSSSAVNADPQILYAHESPIGTWRIASAPGTLAYAKATSSWVKEFTVTVNDNPLRIECSVCYKPTANASYTTKMFINGKLVKEKTWNISPSASTPCSFNNDFYDVY
jgi:hypothetical protein